MRREEIKSGAPKPVMPWPGREASMGPYTRIGGSFETIVMQSPDGRTWGWCERTWRGGHEHEPPRQMGCDEAGAIAMALRGLGWEERDHG